MNRLRRREVLIVTLGVALTAVPAVFLIYGQPSSAEDPPAKGLPPAATEPIDSEKLQAESENAMDRFVLEEFPALGLDPAKIDRTEFNASYDVPFNTLGDAAREADVIAEVSVTSVKFEAGARAPTTARVVQAWKGDVAADVSFLQYAQPVRWEDGTIHLAQQEVAPVLLTGDRAILLLDRTAAGDLEVMPAAGWFKIGEDGRIETAYLPEGFGAIDGLTVGAFATQLAAVTD